jgi:putative transposase
MPVAKNKPTTSKSHPSKSEPMPPQLLEQQEFHQHLRALARSAVRVVIEEVMREELEQFLGVAWGESSPKRKGYRNGHYTRDLVTSTGRLEEIKVPRDREGQFHTQAFERYSRYEPHIARSDSPRCLSPGQARDIRRRSGSNPTGSRSQRQHDQSSQPEPDPPI